MRFTTRADGQALLEWCGVLSVVALVAGAVAASGIGQQVADAITCNVNHALGAPASSCAHRAVPPAGRGGSRPGPGHPSSGFYDCPGAGQPVATAFPKIDVPVRIPGKPYSLSYGELNLSWSSVSSAGGAQCSMQSTSGALPLILNLPLVGPRIVGYSVTTARLDFLGNGAHPPVCDWKKVTRNCSLNGDGPLMVRWSTPGFKEQVDGRTVYDSGPMTYYLRVNSGDVAAELPAAELYIHETLIAHLPMVMPLALVQEPPADLWVRDADGRVTGRTLGGRVLDQIPNSEYFTNGHGYAAVLLLTPGLQRYTAAAIGPAGGAYSLSISSVSPSGIGAATPRSAMRSGRLGPSGSSTLSFTRSGASGHTRGDDRFGVRPRKGRRSSRARGGDA